MCSDIVLAVVSAVQKQEAIDILYDAPALADEWRNPVMILVDGLMGQMMEPVLLPEPKQLGEATQKMVDYLHSLAK